VRYLLATVLSTCVRARSPKMPQDGHSVTVMTSGTGISTSAW